MFKRLTERLDRLARGYSTAAGHVLLNTVPQQNTRNIGIIAHIDAGKTTTTERMLFYSGKTLRIGNVDHGDTTTDYLQSERARGITIQLAAITIPWNKNKINIIDTPGHADFTFEVTRSLRVLDGAVTILDAVAGVESQTEKVWRQAAALEIPRIAYINKMDRPGAGFSRTVKEVIQKLQTKAVCLNLPYFVDVPGGETKFTGVVDVIHKKLLLWDELDSNGTVIEAIDLDGADSSYPEVSEMLLKSRESMVETLGELDDAVIEEFFECDENYMNVSPTTLINAIRKATIENVVTPILCGLSFRNIGVQPLLDAVVNYLPSPLEIPTPVITVQSLKIAGKKKKKHTGSDNRPVPIDMVPGKGFVINKNPNLTIALAFKVITHPARGIMTFFRVYSGSLHSNSTVINTRTGKKIHFKKVMLMHGDSPEEVSNILRGNIGVVAGTNDDIVTGDTLISHGATSSKSFSDLESSLQLLPMEVPLPLFNSSIEPATAGDSRHMNECISVLLREDPSLHVHVDEEMGQTVLSGMGELHLEIARDRLVNEMKARVTLRDVAVSFKETISRPSGEVIRYTSTEDPEIYAEVSLDSFEGEASESQFADEEGAILLDQDNNILILSSAASSEHMRTALKERRWKSEASMATLEENLLAGCSTGLQMGGQMFGLPLNSIVVRILNWNFPVESKTAPAAALLEVGRRLVNEAIERLGANQDNFCVLEPIMNSTVFVDSDVLGDATHDLNTRCLATILAIEDEGSERLDHWVHAEAERIYVPPDYTMKNVEYTIKSKKIISAETPLREMIGYLSKLRSMTQGRGAFDMSYKGMSRVNKSRLNVIRGEFSVM